MSPSRRRGFWIAVAAVLAAVNIVLATLVLTGGDDDGDPLAGRVAELEAQENARHVEQVEELTAQTTAAHQQLLAVIAGLHAVVPAEGEPTGTTATPDEMAGWRAAIDEAVAAFGEPPSGSTEFNTARNGLLLSVDLLGSAVSAYESAVAADDEQRDSLLTLASDLRNQAVSAWSVAATQLDVLNIDAGFGHVHINLPSRPGEEVDPHGGVDFEEDTSTEEEDDHSSHND